MDSLLWPLTFWHWWIAAALLMAAELLVPGVYLIWLGVAAAITGLAAFSTGLGWHGQVMLFALLSVAAAALGRMVYVRSKGPTDHPTLNRRADQYIGRVFTLDQPIVNGAGRLRVADSTWKVTGPDAPAGCRVRVTAADGVVLRVEAEE
jgi:membrane protein implicated in regulation of membrane protease activity